jgi:dihydroorotate dehydrogenase (fumarate)
MANLTTQYLGINIPSPIIAGSSGLTGKIDSIRKIADEGAGAIVLKSLFEEQINMEIDAQAVNNMYGNYNDVENYVSFYTKKHNLDEYIKLIKDAKASTKIPVIASINCIAPGEWTNFTKEIEMAGADGIELNMFILPSNPQLTGFEIEKNYFEIIRKVSAVTHLPLSIKLSWYFSSLSRHMRELSKIDEVKSLVLFNRFYNPDINIENETVENGHIYSVPEENAMCLRWIGALYGKINADLAATTGIHNGEIAIKNLLAGAKAVQVASTLYKNGVESISGMNQQISEWMDRKGYEHVSDFVGKLSQQNINRPMIYERAQFMKYFSEHR